MKQFPLIIATILAVSSPLAFANTNVIKMTSSKLCHAPDSPHYNRIKHFVSYPTMEACLQNGGHLPKHAQKDQDTTQSHTASSASTTPDLNNYHRQHFGKGWMDMDHDCQNSRTEALVAQSVGPIRYKTSRDCQVVSGRWTSPYSGDVIYQASKIDMDHVVPLKWAWSHGAKSWSKTQREALANDPANLLAVEASLNRQKGAKGLNEWLPPKNQCQYILRFERIVKKYNLTLTSTEQSAYPALKSKYC